VTTQTQRTGRQLVKPILFDKLTTRITLDHPDLDQPTAERILDQALAYLATAATATQPIGPSALVDIGWHTFLLHTRDYAQFCDRIAGRFIHHEPDTGTGPGVPLTAAVNAIRANGYTIDPHLWGIGHDSHCTDPTSCQAKVSDCTATCAVPVALADCTQCHAGCTDSPSH
jgi:hypothetical protein